VPPPGFQGTISCAVSHGNFGVAKAALETIATPAAIAPTIDLLKKFIFEFSL
tara:strand:- start:569 stop:724 length:156 start_codon:yes stop_codon:yes gene_type:complete